MPALFEHIRTQRVMRRVWGWMPLLVCVLAITLTAPAAKASFVLEYNGAPFSNTGLDCNQMQCLTGNVIIDFVVIGTRPPDGQTFCLSLVDLGDTSGSCFAVETGWVRNGATTIEIVGNPNNIATFQLGPSASYWLVHLDGLSTFDPPSQLLTSKSAYTGVSELLQLNDSTHTQAVGLSHTGGTWSYVGPRAQETPEPATWAALGIGLSLVGLLRAKRKTAARMVEGVRR